MIYQVFMIRNVLPNSNALLSIFSDLQANVLPSVGIQCLGHTKANSNSAVL